MAAFSDIRLPFDFELDRLRGPSLSSIVFRILRVLELGYDAWWRGHLTLTHRFLSVYPRSRPDWDHFCRHLHLIFRHQLAIGHPLRLGAWKRYLVEWASDSHPKVSRCLFSRRRLYCDYHCHRLHLHLCPLR